MSWPGVAAKDGSGSLPRLAGFDRRFPRSRRLTARKQFEAVYHAGGRVRSSSFSLFGLPNDKGHCRLGITVTRKLGGAVRRNLVKRRIREVFRRCGHDLQPALDLVVNAHRGIERRTTSELETEFLRSFAALAPRFRD